METILQKPEGEIQSKNPLSIFYNDIFLFAFVATFFSMASYSLNQGDILTFNEQLALINKPKFAAFLMMIVGFIPLHIVLKEAFFTAKDGQPLSKYTSIWVPVRYAVLLGFFIPFEQNHVATSTVVEIFKMIIGFLSN